MIYRNGNLESRDWKHLWLNSDGWDAFAVWLEARWEPLEPEDRLAFVFRVAGTPDDLSIAYGEHGDLVDDTMLSVEAYANDPELPEGMIDPFVHLGGGPF